MRDDFGESAGESSPRDFIKDEFNLDGFGASFSSVTDELSLTGVDTGLERKAQVSNPPLGFASLNGDEDIFMLDDPHGLMVDPIDPNDPSAPGLPPCGSGLALVPGSRSSLFSAQSTVMEMEMDGETKAGTAAVDWLLCPGVSGDVSGGNGMILLLHIVTPFKPFPFAGVRSSAILVDENHDTLVRAWLVYLSRQPRLPRTDSKLPSILPQPALLVVPDHLAVVSALSRGGYPVASYNEWRMDHRLASLVVATYEELLGSGGRALQKCSWAGLLLSVGHTFPLLRLATICSEFRKSCNYRVAADGDTELLTRLLTMSRQCAERRVPSWAALAEGVWSPDRPDLLPGLLPLINWRAGERFLSAGTGDAERQQILQNICRLGERKQRSLSTVFSFSSSSSSWFPSTMSTDQVEFIADTSITPSETTRQEVINRASTLLEALVSHTRTHKDGLSDTWRPLWICVMLLRQALAGMTSVCVRSLPAMLHIQLYHDTVLDARCLAATELVLRLSSPSSFSPDPTTTPAPVIAVFCESWGPLDMLETRLLGLLPNAVVTILETTHDPTKCSHAHQWRGLSPRSAAFPGSPSSPRPAPGVVRVVLIYAPPEQMSPQAHWWRAFVDLRVQHIICLDVGLAHGPRMKQLLSSLPPTGGSVHRLHQFFAPHTMEEWLMTQLRFPEHLSTRSAADIQSWLTTDSDSSLEGQRWWCRQLEAFLSWQKLQPPSSSLQTL